MYGNNYIKLHDVAAAFNHSEKQFNVAWNAEKKAISIISEEAYKMVGTELETNAAILKNVTASGNTSPIYLDNKKVEMKAYNIGGNTYFQLRDLGSLVNFYVGWDAVTQTVTMDTNKGYGA